MTSCNHLLWTVINDKFKITDLLTDLHKFDYDTSNIAMSEQEKANCVIDEELANVLKYTYNNQHFDFGQAVKYKPIKNMYDMQDISTLSSDQIFYKLLEQNVLNKFNGQYFIAFLSEMLKIDINLFKSNPKIKCGTNDKPFITHDGDKLSAFENNSNKSHKNNKMTNISVTNDDPQITEYANKVFYSTFPSPVPTPTAQISSDSPTHFGIPPFPLIDESFGGNDEKKHMPPPGLTKSTGIFTGATYILPDEVRQKNYSSPSSPPRTRTSISSCNNTPERTKKQSVFDRYKEGYYSESKLHAILKEKYIALEEKSKKELELVTDRYEAEKKVLQDQIDTFKSQFDQISRVNDFLMKNLEAHTQIPKDN
jgi:hypothetical protein